MTDLSAFNVTCFPSGNVPGGSAYEQDINESHDITNVTGFTAALQLLYPADSVNPSSKSPVKGGKLPGLYGGHTGCSGGAAAEDCLSTRLMWRPGGAGEPYLDCRSTRIALYSNPQSVCDYEYGLSIGRGSFHYSRGNWTNLRQDIVLNTPGKQDGAFTLFMDGKQATNRTDIFYPNTRWSAGNSGCRNGYSTRNIGFVRRFFSTFFGGHGDGWATPKQQYAWFKDFAMTHNS
ncbi:polysaccharide lyase family 14 protein [Suillus paluster]|uniref:polysaccharide lyase family 14 protein n=1 Tax=Suillus paluster TaxID=48578 RepID=UPI001B8695BF|nr:polysaccharide lyase family 14 protein [Suillus paluster]KAG1722332.1 polysaccharide lyase family 14 protein [Suillus paluster]